jgi:hypothetical protein
MVAIMPDRTKRIEATLAICSHNPGPTYFKRVLDSVRKQSLAKDSWELIVVDNLSTAPIAPDWDLSWHPLGRHVVESELGLSSARRRAMKEAFSDLLVFVDDDNVLDPTYMARALEIKHAWPQLGVWGAGVIIPEFEVQPKEYLEPLLHYLAIREITAPRWTNVYPCFEAAPWGAGLCVRSSVATAYEQHCQQSSIHITGRKGDGLLSGEDLEIDYLAREMGFEQSHRRIRGLVARLASYYLAREVVACQLRSRSGMVKCSQVVQQSGAERLSPQNDGTSLIQADHVKRGLARIDPNRADNGGVYLAWHGVLLAL